ncbi:TIGR03643 family protein [Gammaproteobacteria bacterium]|nr:TIGR03643 family protein [Gammaproteobacteria bacterium]
MGWASDLTMTHQGTDIHEIIQMAWCDRTAFDDIEALTGMSESAVIKLMRRELKPSSFRLWRKRVTGRSSKHHRQLKS